MVGGCLRHPLSLSGFDCEIVFCGYITLLGFIVAWSLPDGNSCSDETITAQEKTFAWTKDGEEQSMTLTFHARSKTASYNHVQQKQPLIIFVNDPCDIADWQELNKYFGELTALRDSGGPTPTGLVTLYFSTPSGGKKMELSAGSNICSMTSFDRRPKS